MTKARNILLAAMVLSFVCACEDDGANYLDGSLTDSYEMKFSETRARYYTNDRSLSIEYVNGEGGIPARVTVDVGDDGLQTGLPYDLMEEGDITRGSGFDSYLPEMESGELVFSSVGSQAGATIAGEFSGRFVGSDGSKMVLRGGFDTVLEIPEI